jgi:hypothetical protein
MFEPGAATVGAVCAIARSALVNMLVVAVEELFAALGSVVVEATLAVFEIVAAAAGVTFTVSVIVADAAAVIVPSAQLTVVVPLHVPCEGVAETNVVPAGSTSTTDTPAASEGPLFVVVIV